MKTRSSFPGEVCVLTIPHQPSAGGNILMVVSTRGSSDFQAHHKGCVYPSHGHLQAVFNITWWDGEENTKFYGTINHCPGTNCVTMNNDSQKKNSQNK